MENTMQSATSDKYIIKNEDIGKFSELFDTMGNKLFIGDILLARQCVRINRYKVKLGDIKPGIVMGKKLIILSDGLAPNSSLIIDPMIDKSANDIFYKYFKVSDYYEDEYEALSTCDIISCIMGFKEDVDINYLVKFFGELNNVYVSKEETTEDDEEE